jgi:hypothetical protein
MDHICERIVEILDERRAESSMRLRISFEVRAPAPRSARVPNDDANSSDAPASFERLLVIEPAHGAAAGCSSAAADPCAAPGVLLNVGGVRFHPKFVVVSSLVETWIEEIAETRRGARIEMAVSLAATVGACTVYRKRLRNSYQIDLFGAKNKKAINSLSQEILKVRDLACSIERREASAPPTPPVTDSHGPEPR